MPSAISTRVGLLSIVGALTLALSAGNSVRAADTAQAINWGSTPCETIAVRTCVSFANNGTHAVRFDNLGNNVPGIADAVIWSLYNNYNATDMSAYRDEGDPNPDVWVSDDNYGSLSEITAWVDCPIASNSGITGTDPNRTCRGQNLFFNSYYNSVAFQTPVRRQRMACHELGHTVGFRHRTYPSLSSCMDQYARSDADDALDAHDLAHVNNRY